MPRTVGISGVGQRPVSFPAKAFPRPVVAAHESRSAASSAPAGSSGTTYLPLQ